MDSMDSHDMPSAKKQKIRNYPAYNAHGILVAPCSVTSAEYRKCEKCKHMHAIEAFMKDFNACVYCSGGRLGRREDAQKVRVSFALFSAFACCCVSVLRFLQLCRCKSLCAVPRR